MAKRMARPTTSSRAKPDAARRGADSVSERERRFVEAFTSAAAGNATRAAELAGYAKTTAEKQASRLLRRVGVCRAIDAARAARSTAAIADREQRQAWWSDVMNDRRVGMKWRLKASELLARAQGDFIERRIVGFSRTLEDLVAEAGSDTPEQPH